jgi:hypothetical protein
MTIARKHYQKAVEAEQVRPFTTLAFVEKLHYCEDQFGGGAGQIEDAAVEGRDGWWGGGLEEVSEEGEKGIRGGCGEGEGLGVFFGKYLGFVAHFKEFYFMI